ncbi:MAG TPA: hypothetical protein VFS04_00665 [Alphaproteobacteria bacterium]|nr:hypothetical protein [Alphaproteobacteria bacterium]
MSAMSPEEVRLECLSLAVECREARHSAADVVALAAAFEMYVKEPSKPTSRKTVVKSASDRD